MLFLLDQGWALLGALIGLALGVLAQGIAQAYAARSLLGDRQGQLAGRLRPDPRHHLDPFGVVVAMIANPPVTWGKPVPFAEPKFGKRGRFVATCLVGPLAHLVLGLALLGALTVAGGGVTDDGFLRAGTGGLQVLGGIVLFGTEPLLTVLGVAGLVNVLCAVLRLIPLPPLDGARILWVYAPRTEGWRKARYWLEEQNVGIGLLILLMIPVFGDTGLLLRVVQSVTRALLGLLGPVL
jgi:Zn-dependent protease